MRHSEDIGSTQPPLGAAGDLEVNLGGSRPLICTMSRCSLIRS
jgi:hypothetical protein